MAGARCWVLRDWAGLVWLLCVVVVSGLVGGAGCGGWRWLVENYIVDASIFRWSVPWLVRVPVVIV